MRLSCEQFVKRLAGGAPSIAAAVRPQIEQLQGQHSVSDGVDLAELLVDNRVLTQFQADRVLEDKARSLIIGKYAVIDQLGQGGMGVVYKAVHLKMNRVVALKTLSSRVTHEAEARRRFQREIAAVARLEHPNIVTAYDADADGDTDFFVMQYVDGVDLASIVRKLGPLSESDAVNCVIQAARGLEYAHSNQIVHRDVKPSNLMLDRNGVVKVLDLGLARVASESDPESLTDVGQIMGTAAYMAPEQARTSRLADLRADVYSLGASLWYLLASAELFPGESVVEKLMAHQNTPVPSLSKLRPDVSGELETVLLGMLAKAPGGRFQTMGAVVAALERCVMSGGGAELDGLVRQMEVQIIEPDPAVDATALEQTLTMPLAAPLVDAEREPTTITTAAEPKPPEPVARGSRRWAPFAVLILLGVGLVGAAGFGMFGGPAKTTRPSGAGIRPAEENFADWVNVLEKIDPRSHVPQQPFTGGKWTLADGVLTSPEMEFARIEAPVATSNDYEVVVDFTRHSGDAISIYLPVAGRQVLFVIDGFQDTGLSGLQSIDGESLPVVGVTGVGEFRLENGRRYSVWCQVRESEGQVRIDVDLSEGFQFSWEGKLESLGLIDHRFQLTDPARLGVAAWEAKVDFHRFVYRDAKR